MLFLSAILLSIQSTLAFTVAPQVDGPQKFSAKEIVQESFAKAASLVKPTADDYEKLQVALGEFVTPATIPKLVRMSFHDLINFDKGTGKGAAQGCIFDQRVAAFNENNGLNATALALKAFVVSKFPNIDFSSGDIVSLAGKVAVEEAYPCIQVAWGFGRQSCKDIEQAGGPEPTILNLEQLKPFTDRYGLTPTEMAILTNGAHGIAGAVNNDDESGIFSFKFADKNSGTDFIKTCATSDWQVFPDWFGNGPDATSGHAIGRFQSDMMFFPTTLKKLEVPSKSIDESPEMAAIEKNLLGLNDAEFNKQFGAVYAKMLQIGTAHNKLSAFSQGKTTC